MIWKGEELKNIGDHLNALCELKDRKEGEAYMNAYREETQYADVNVGYIVGYLEPAELRQRVYEITNAFHPISGGRH